MQFNIAYDQLVQHNDPDNAQSEEYNVSLSESETLRGNSTTTQ